MIKREVTFENFDGETQTRELYFHIGKNRLASFSSEVETRLKNLVKFLEERPEGTLEPQDVETIQGLVEFFIEESYGIRDGDEFLTVLSDGRRAVDQLKNQAVYGELVFQIMQENSGLKFVLDLLPADMVRDSMTKLEEVDSERASELKKFLAGDPIKTDPPEVDALKNHSVTPEKAEDSELPDYSVEEYREFFKKAREEGRL